MPASRDDPEPPKLGNIILFKKEGKPECEASSYRPISLLPTIGKVLEKLFTQRLSYHLGDLTRLAITREVEKEETGWAAHPAECPSENHISLVDGVSIISATRIYTDGSKTEKGIEATFCIWSGQNIVYRWMAKLQDYNTVFQAKFLTLKDATDNASKLPNQPITILVDNKASVQVAANPRSRNTISRKIFKSLITNKHIPISSIKAHVGCDGNEEADRLAKKAAEV
ncbi:hypothetical protein AVEN_68546-1 [Araneus ventricosus]|uniref:RNase H type-1 domain-containing protein n=1 Tax=Araneus ventricosus TaxID=182803 RepID=A0A4Y2HCS1_ARAVE|nr:hypothetical protein AVEN_68546-1 [Araneus ventricosus]